ncbi:hypothetical protein LOAG_16647 [Loa loa]|uniref:Uncharacterized protein n=1 Tax=Loa loa TaxID=7209 RepID=A0A1S0ULG8_LOALO|nr:hypothetical protein LOAG_16647 [Loa loa]EJD76413.1 hypothetical protein LOAG_16647 [Loa loa]
MLKVEVVALFVKLDEQELMSMFKSRRTEIGLENIESNPDRLNSIFDIVNHSTAYQQGSYFIKEMEMLEQQIGTGNKIVPCDLSYQLTFHNEEQRTFMEKKVEQKHKCTASAWNVDESMEQIMKEQIQEWSPATENTCTYAITKIDDYCYSGGRNIRSTSESAEPRPSVNVDCNHLYMFTKCSVLPMRIEHESGTVKAQSYSSKEEACSERSVFFPDIFSTKYLDLIFSNQVFTRNNAGTCTNELCKVNRRNQRQVPSPPWQQFLHRVRGRFIADTRRLMKLQETVEPNNVHDCDFFKKEIPKRKCRIEIFDEIHTKHMQMLEKSPHATKLITE